jgi:hypothetical protein
MVKIYCIGANRYVTVKKIDGELVVIIEERGSDKKKVILNGQRWARFVLAADELKIAVCQLRKRQFAESMYHLGGEWFATTNTDHFNVQLRRYYLNTQQEMKPSQEGIALRLPEWDQLMELVKSITKKFPNATPCWLQADHADSVVYQNCKECVPFPTTVTPVYYNVMHNFECDSTKQ